MLRCLIVDDDELERELVAHYLDSVAECEMAENGCDAVVKFREAFEGGKPFDLIILDIVMPEMDGHTAAKEIRRIEKEGGRSVDNGVKIIVISSLHTPKDIIQSYMSANSAAHIVKPVNPDRLLKILSKVGMLELTEKYHV